MLGNASDYRLMMLLVVHNLVAVDHASKSLIRN